jgi:hypothetical protein
MKPKPLWIIFNKDTAEIMDLFYNRAEAVDCMRRTLYPDGVLIKYVPFNKVPPNGE